MNGEVWIVGAGPGDPELLTLRALRALENADVVLHDRLVSPEVMRLIPEGVERVYVGKGHGDQDTVQPEIMNALEDFARQGKRVVRLKGGDPFVFGRGAEEWAFLAERGIRVHVVPGISSSLAVPALAGIPLTFRGLARAFAVVTGHRALKSGADLSGTSGVADHDAPTDWRGYVGVDTLVILMGVKERASIARNLIEAGRDPSEPIAFIERGSTPGERVVTGRLEDAWKLDVDAPAVWVIGRVVELRQGLRLELDDSVLDDTVLGDAVSDESVGV